MAWSEAIIAVAERPSRARNVALPACTGAAALWQLMQAMAQSRACQSGWEGVAAVAPAIATPGMTSQPPTVAETNTATSRCVTRE